MYICQILTAIPHHCVTNSKVFFFCFPFTWYGADSYKQTNFHYLSHTIVCGRVYSFKWYTFLIFFVKTGQILEEKKLLIMFPLLFKFGPINIF